MQQMSDETRLTNDQPKSEQQRRKVNAKRAIPILQQAQQFNNKLKVSL